MSGQRAEVFSTSVASAGSRSIIRSLEPRLRAAQLVLQNCVANEFFYNESLAAGSLNQLPAPLGRNLADAWSNITAQNNRNKVLILLHDVYSYSQCDSQIHITTVVRPQFAGSGEPATKAITLYYWLHNDITIYRSTIIHFVLFYFFSLFNNMCFPLL